MDRTGCCAMTKEGFASRWSRMKQEQRAEPSLPVVELDTAEDSKQQAEQLNSLTDADMPSLDSLNESSDYSGFLSEKVSEAVRKAALRKLFHQPAYNVIDGLDDYAEDYTVFEPLGDIIPHDMKRMMKLDAERELAKREQAELQLQQAQQASADSAEPGTQVQSDTLQTDGPDSEALQAQLPTHDSDQDI